MRKLILIFVYLSLSCRTNAEMPICPEGFVGKFIYFDFKKKKRKNNELFKQNKEKIVILVYLL